MKKLIIIAVIILIVLIIFIANRNKITYQNITDDMAIVELQNNPNIVLLDVRSKEEHEEKRIPNSISIPLDELEERIANEIKDKQTKIFVYCKTGIRSEQASKTLVSLGYTNVYNLGGLENWKYETE